MVSFNQLSFWSNWMVSPREMTERYVNMVSRSVDNTFTATRLASNMALANMEAFRASIQQTKENSKDFSRIATNDAKMFELAIGEYMKLLNRLKTEKSLDGRENSKSKEIT
jgi:predicted RNA-binding protein